MDTKVVSEFDFLTLTLHTAASFFVFVSNEMCIRDSSKGHGWGLESVKYIVKKYDGIIEFEYTEMFFQTVIMIEGE